MTKAKPISVSFADFKILKTRGQAQLIFELPLEQADAALRELGGLPQAKSERPCAIILLDPSKTYPTSPESPATPIKERRRFHEMPLPQQAGMLCQEPMFWAYLREHHGVADSPASAADVLRSVCGIASRSELTTAPNAAAIFREMVGDYDVWKMAVV